MKKYNPLVLLMSVVLLMTASCDDYLDINTDPDGIGSVPDVKVIMPVAQMQIAQTTMGWEYGFTSGLWSEYWTQNYTASQFKSACEYRETSYSYAYSGLTAGALKDLQTIIRDSPADNNGYAYIAEALSIYTRQLMVDTWDDIPYSEALNSEIDAPKFDEGEDVYKDLLARIEVLINTDLSDAIVDANYDYFFGGDLNDWERFVKSLKLKLIIRTSETSNFSASDALSFVNSNSANFLTESAKISGDVWSNEEGKRHPMNEFQDGGANYISGNVIGCKTFIDYLEVNQDPRLNTLFSKGGNAHEGAFFGDFESKEDSDGDGTTDAKESYSQPIFADNMDLIIMSNWEISFYLSEIYARNNMLAEAKTFYEEGIKNSLRQHDIAENTIVETGYAVWQDGSVESCLKQIAMQKWVANANYQHGESFFERNRLKYPAVNDIDIMLDRRSANDNFPLGEFTISVEGRARTSSLMPASAVYPDAVLTRNPNAPPQKDNITVKVWWDQKNGK